MGERAGLRPHGQIFAQHFRAALCLQRRGASSEGSGYHAAADRLDRAGDGRGAQRGDGLQPPGRPPYRRGQPAHRRSRIAQRSGVACGGGLLCRAVERGAGLRRREAHSVVPVPLAAGIGGALVGSFYSILICLLLAFPVEVLASIYLEEFAPKNKITDFIEININNLAAVPSIVYGLLALQILLATIQLPRSTPLVAGITLAIMTLPRIIIPCRASLKAVPPSIREGALAVGASKFQSVFHHVVPLALPGTLSGTIIGLAQALGETAPLILIGMVAFVVDIPSTPIDPSSSLPVQVYLWSESAERGFVEKTSATIMMLLSFLIVMNFLAVYLRQKFEKRWN